MELKKHPWKQCEFELYKDNEPTGKIYVLNDENNWCIEEWLDDKHEYDFREINIPRGYKPEYYRYRDDQINNIRVSNNPTWTINLTCEFVGDENSEVLRPNDLTFYLKCGEIEMNVTLNNNYEWTSTINDILETDINILQHRTISKLNNTPRLLFYEQDFLYKKNEVNHEIDLIYTFTFNQDISGVFQNLMESVLETYVKSSEVETNYVKQTELTNYVKQTELDGILSVVGLFKIPNNNMRIRRIENEIKRLQRELDIIKLEI